MESAAQGPFLNPTHVQMKIQADSLHPQENENEKKSWNQDPGSSQISSLEITLGNRLEMVASHANLLEALKALNSWTDVKLQNGDDDDDDQGKIFISLNSLSFAFLFFSFH